MSGGAVFSSTAQAMTPDPLALLNPDDSYVLWTAWDWCKEAGVVALAFLGVWAWIGWQARRR